MLRFQKSWLVATLLSVGLIAACDSEPQPAAKAGGAATDDGKPAKKPAKPAKPAKTSAPDDCEKTATTLTDDDSGIEGDGFSLQATVPNYTVEIKELLDTYCVGCHGPVTVRGMTRLDTYADAKLKGVRANTRIGQATNQMPPAAPLDATRKALFQAWITGGMLEKPVVATPTPTATPSGSPSASPSPSGSGTPSTPSDPCATASPSPSPTNGADDEYKDIMNPPKLKECHDKGDVFNRIGAGSCHEAKLSSGTCDSARALQTLGGGPAATDVIAKNTADGFVVDQCGESSTRKYIFWVKKYKTGETLMLDIKSNSILK